MAPQLISVNTAVSNNFSEPNHSIKSDFFKSQHFLLLKPCCFVQGHKTIRFHFLLNFWQTSIFLSIFPAAKFPGCPYAVRLVWSLIRATINLQYYSSLGVNWLSGFAYVQRLEDLQTCLPIFINREYLIPWDNKTSTTKQGIFQYLEHQLRLRTYD